MASIDASSASKIIRRAVPFEPRFRARFTGAVYLVYFVTAIGGAALAARGFPVAGTTFNGVAIVLYAGVTLLLYELFAPVDERLSLAAALLSLAGCALQALGLFQRLPHLNPLLFFGLYCGVIGVLILKSTLLPRAIGIVMVCAGVGWLLVLLPPLAHRIAAAVAALGVAAEASLMLWLLVKGVKLPGLGVHVEHASPDRQS